MKSIKEGFTLAEMLITLSLIGVLAALTLPSVMKNTGSAKISASLCRAVEEVETSIANIFADARTKNSAFDVKNSISALQVKDILDDSNNNSYLADGDILFSTTNAMLGTLPVSNSYLRSVTNYNGSTLLTSTYSNFGSYPAYKFSKRNSIIIPETIDSSNIDNYLTTNGLSDLPPDVVIQRIFVDANGEERPNSIGKDIFLFGLTDSGHMIPAGTQAYNNNIFNETIPLYTISCNGNSVSDGRSCAGRVASDKWKINY